MRGSKTVDQRSNVSRAEPGTAGDPGATSWRPSHARAPQDVLLPAELLGFELHDALAKLGHNRRLHAELLLQFIAEHCDCTTSVSRALTLRRPAEAAAMLHRLRGAAVVVGARHVADAARDLERDVMRGDAPSVDRLHDAMRDATALVLANVALQSPTDRSRSPKVDDRQLLLVVDDDPINLRALVEALGGEYRTRVATDGAQALEIAMAEDPPDLVLLDIRMPGMDGYEVCRRLKGQEGTRHIPVVFVTTLDEEENETRGLDAGAIDYITKPVNPRILRARVRAHLGVKGTQDRFAELSRVDQLTGIANRRRFDEVLTTEWRRNLRQRTPLALVMCDIDHFKAFNDSHGHVAGDRCLRRVALAIAGAMRRPTDIAARYGGEEFAALLTNTDLDGARRVAEAIGVSVARAGSSDGSGASERVTISCGVASVVPSDGAAPTTLVERADAWLYQAKAAGRNRVAG